MKTMKKFKEMTPKELDTIESVCKNNLKKINTMIDLLSMRPKEFKKMFEYQFEDNIKNRRNYLNKVSTDKPVKVVEVKPPTIESRMGNAYSVSTEIASKLLKYKYC